MTERKQKLELTWIGKHKQPQIESRILIGDVAFQKATLRFAGNGQRQDTLCAIRRSCQSGRHEVITDLGGETGLYRAKDGSLE